jgi:hypothetical protein
MKISEVELCMKKMKCKEIDCLYPPNNETTLQIAAQNQHKETIRLLLLHDAQ